MSRKALWVKIRSKLGPNEGPGEGFGGGRVQRGRSSWEGSVAPRIGRSEKEFQKRSFRWYMPCLPRYVPVCIRTRKGTPQGISR